MQLQKTHRDDADVTFRGGFLYNSFSWQSAEMLIVLLTLEHRFLCTLNLT